MKKVFTLNEEAKNKVKSGIDKVANAVKLTLGPSGRNAIIGRPFQEPLITNDGITIAREIFLDDELENLGAEMVKAATKSANDIAGDGTTTTTVLLQAIMKTGFERLNIKSLVGSANPMAIRNEINEACKLVLAELKTRAIKIDKLEDLIKVATVSVESPEIGEIIAKMFKKLGKDALITTQDNYDLEIETDTTEGTDIEAGLFSDYMANSDKNNKTEYIEEKPFILITNSPINTVDEIRPLIQQIVDRKKSLVIVSENFSKEVLQAFVEQKMQGIFTVIAIKAPTTTKSYLLEDLATMVQAKFIDKQTRDIKSVTSFELGTCDKVIVGKDKTIFLGTHGDTEERVLRLKMEEAKADSLYDKENIKKRLQKLSGGIGVIKVGAKTDAEREYLKLKIEDAVNATRYALEEGVVRGGGLTLKDIAEKLEPNILTESLKAPYNQIQENAGGKLEIGEDIIDPVKITRTCVEKACSIAGMVLTTEIAIADRREVEKDFNN